MLKEEEMQEMDQELEKQAGEEVKKGKQELASEDLPAFIKKTVEEEGYTEIPIENIEEILKIPIKKSKIRLIMKDGSVRFGGMLTYVGQNPIEDERGPEEWYLSVRSFSPGWPQFNFKLKNVKTIFWRGIDFKKADTKDNDPNIYKKLEEIMEKDPKIFKSKKKVQEFIKGKDEYKDVRIKHIDYFRSNYKKEKSI